MKVLIVDDEMVIRIGLKSLIDWEGNGYKLIGEANDGKKALEIFMEKQPDIVITDIKMPVMDGIELIKELKKQPNVPRIVVMSGYNDFQLVRDAMRLGVGEYILKLEMEPEGLLKILDNLRLKIAEERQQKDKRLQLNVQIHKNIPVMRRKLLRDAVFSGHIKDEDFYDSCEFLGVNLDFNSICAMAVKIEEVYKFEDMSEEDIDLLNFSIINIVEEILNDNFTGYCFEINRGEFCIVFSLKEKDEQAFDNRVIADTARRFIEMLKKYLNVTGDIGIGEKGSKIEGFRETYMQARKALDYRFFNSNGNIMFWSGIKSLPSPKGNQFSIFKYKTKLHSALELHRMDELHAFFAKLFEDTSTAFLNRQTFCNVGLELFYMISEFFEKYQVAIKDILISSYRSYQQLVYMDSYSQLNSWISQVENDLKHYIQRETEADYPRVIAKAKAYIEEYFVSDISIKEVADSVNLNPSYFSTLFMQHVGMCYTDYITKVRVEKAKLLLKDTDYKVYEISNMVGYQNVTYFNRTFKKLMGITPVEYKNKAVKA